MLPRVVMEMRTYLDGNGKSPFEDWFAALDAPAAAKVTVALARIELGNLSSVKSVGDGVLESKIDWGPGYRVYFGRDGNVLLILLTGGTKKRQQRDIDAAKTLWANYKQQRLNARRTET